MHQLGYLGDVLVEQTERVRVGQHEGGRVVAYGRPKLVHVHPAAGVALHAHRLVAGHGHRGRVGAVRAVRNDDLLRRAAGGIVIGVDEQQTGELAVGAGCRL